MTPSLSTFLDDRIRLGMKAGLENICTLLRESGDPQKSFQSIHVVGTNGKGSTAYMLARLLQHRGCRTGLFTSPHLVSFRERIRVDETFLSAADAEVLFEETRELCERVGATYFETMTLWAFLHFQRSKVGWAVLEAGLGGRLDSTREARGQGAILTGISVDHSGILGATVEEILPEKLGVLEDGGWWVSGEEKLKRQVKESCLGHSWDLRFVDSSGGLNRSRALALAAVEKIAGVGEPAADKSALKDLVWTGRQQVLGETENFHWILDGAHNPEAANCLANWLKKHWSGRKFRFAFSVLKDKDLRGILSPLLPLAETFVAVKGSHPNSLLPKDVLQTAQQLGYTGETDVQNDGKSFLEKLQRLPANQKKGWICTGSLFLVGEMVHLLSKTYPELDVYSTLEPDPSEVR